MDTPKLFFPEDEPLHRDEINEAPLEHKNFMLQGVVAGPFVGYDSGERFHGSAYPWFTIEVAREIATIVNAKGDSRVQAHVVSNPHAKTEQFWWFQVDRTIEEDESPTSTYVAQTIKTVDGELLLLPCGGEEWVWIEV